MRDLLKSKAEIYIASLYSSETSLMSASRQAAEELNLARISLSSVEGSFLSFLMNMGGYQKVVEIGTLTGLSAQYLLEGMGPGSELWSLEKNPLHWQKAQEILEKYKSINTSIKVNTLCGDAREILPTLNSQGPFDAVFIDGNKAAYGEYADWAITNVRIGGLIVMDNVFLGGAIWGDPVEARISEKQIRIVHETNLMLAQHKDWKTCLIPTAEGLLLSLRVR